MLLILPWIQSLHQTRSDSIDLIIKRLQATFGQSVMDDVQVDGIPYDMQSAQRLFAKSPFDFERWAVSMLHAQPNEKQVGDKGVDGVRHFIIDSQNVGKVLVSVKGGKTVPPTHVRDLAGTVHHPRDAQLGVLITLNDSHPRRARSHRHFRRVDSPRERPGLPRPPAHLGPRPHGRPPPQPSHGAGSVHLGAARRGTR